MSIKITSREKASRRNKQKIYDAALYLFEKYDFDTVTVNDICRHSKLSKGTFYHYFNSKEDLVVIGFTRGLDRYLKQHYRPSKEKSFEENYIDFIMCMCYYAESVGKSFTRRSYMAQISTQVELRIEDRLMVNIIDDLIAEGKKLKLFRFDYSDLELYTHIVGTFTGLLVKWSTDTKGIIDFEHLIKNQFLALLKI